MKYLLLVPIMLSLFMACNQMDSSEMAGESSAYAKSAMSPETSMTDEQGQSMDHNQQIQIYDRKVIKSASITMEVEDLAVSNGTLDELCKKYQGYVAEMNEHTGSRQIRNTLTVKIPAEQFDDFIKELDALSIHRDYKQISSDDVTEEFVDITARLKTKKAVHQRYVEILRDKAQTVEEILLAEGRIRIVQEEIESIEGRLKYLNAQSAMSTIHLEMYQLVPFVQRPIHAESYFTLFGKSFSKGWKAVKSFSLAMVSIWPFLILIGMAFFLVGRRLRFTRRPYNPSPPSPSS